MWKQIGVLEDAPHIEDTSNDSADERHVDFTQLFVVSKMHSQLASSTPITTRFLQLALLCCQ